MARKGVGFNSGIKGMFFLFSCQASLFQSAEILLERLAFSL